VAASQFVCALCCRGCGRRAIPCWEREQVAVGAAQAEEEGGELLGVKPVEVARLNPAGAPIFSLAVDGAAPDPSAALPDARQQARRPSQLSPQPAVLHASAGAPSVCRVSEADRCLPPGRVFRAARGSCCVPAAHGHLGGRTVLDGCVERQALGGGRA
jgi:hypothetical protein